MKKVIIYYLAYVLFLSITLTIFLYLAFGVMDGFGSENLLQDTLLTSLTTAVILALWLSYLELKKDSSSS